MMGIRAAGCTTLYYAGAIGSLVAVFALLFAAGPVAAQEAPGAALSKSVPERDATTERQILALQQESAKNSYLSMRPYLSRYIGFAIFLGLCVALIVFLRKRLEQREYLRRIGFLETPEIEPEED